MMERGQDKIRKQVYDLREKDLADYSIWEFALDEEGETDQDEATVRPVEQSNNIDFSDGIFIVRAVFSLYDGTILTGYVTPDNKSDFGTMQPTIITKDGQVAFWYGMISPTRDEIGRAYRQLNKTSKEVFPITFKSDSGIRGINIEGDIKGFAYSPNPDNNQTVIVA